MFDLLGRERNGLRARAEAAEHKLRVVEGRMNDIKDGINWLNGKKSIPSHIGAKKTEDDLQTHLMGDPEATGIRTKKQAKAALDRIEAYFIQARLERRNAVWAGFLTMRCYRTPGGKEIIKIRWHKPVKEALLKLTKVGKKAALLFVLLAPMVNF